MKKIKVEDNTNDNGIFQIIGILLIGFAVVELLVRREEIENFNKKALYILIREMTNVDTNHITKVVNVMRHKYKILFNEYTKTGVINYHSTGSKFFK